MSDAEVFIKNMSSSRLGQALRDLGMTESNEVMQDEKDWGEGAISYFNIGHVYYKLPHKPTEGFHTDDDFGSDRPDISIYHSRYSDRWYLDIRGQRYEGMGLEASALNDASIVADIVETVKSDLHIK